MSIDQRHSLTEICPNNPKVLHTIDYSCRGVHLGGNIVTCITRISSCPHYTLAAGCGIQAKILSHHPETWSEKLKRKRGDSDILPSLILDQTMMHEMPSIMKEIKQEKIKELEILTQQATSYFFNLA